MLWAFHVVWYAMTADTVLSDVLGSDTRRQLPQVKIPYIYRSNKKGNCLGSVGRWGLLKQALRSFSALKPLKWAFYRGFRAGDSGIFEKNDPNCHSRRCQFGAQSGKTGLVASRPWAIASRFGRKMKKSAASAFVSEKLFIFAAVLIIYGMKKVFIVMVMALLSLGAQAQSLGYTGFVDEKDLLGKWVIFNAEGDWESLKKPSAELPDMNITFYENGEADLGGIDRGSNYVYDWFISNSNKLHFITLNKAVRFIIWNYTKDELLVLRAFNKSIFLHFKKDNSSNVSSVRINKTDNQKYNIQGVKVEDPEGIYIQNGQKFIAK